MASKSTNNNEIPKNEDEKKGLIELIAEKIKSDKEIREEYAKGDDERERNLYHSDAIKSAVKALDDDQWEEYKKLGWGRPPQFILHAVLRTNLYDYKPRSSAVPSKELIEAVYAKLHEKKMAKQIVRQRMPQDPNTMAGLQAKVSSFLGGKRTRKRRNKRRHKRRRRRRRTKRRIHKKKKRRRRTKRHR